VSTRAASAALLAVLGCTGPVVAAPAGPLTVGYEAPDARSLLVLTDAVHAAAAGRKRTIIDDTAVTGLRHDGLMRLSARGGGSAALLVSARRLSDGSYLLDITGVGPGPLLVRRYRVAAADRLAADASSLFIEALAALGVSDRGPGEPGRPAPGAIAAGQPGEVGWSGWAVSSLVAAGVGVASLGSALLFGTKALDARDAANECAQAAGEACPRRQYDVHVNESEDAALVADISWIVAVGAGVASLVTFFMLKLDNAEVGSTSESGWSLTPASAGGVLIYRF